MKAEKRGKYPGVKLHLDEKEVHRVIQDDLSEEALKTLAWWLLVEVRTCCKKLLADHPDLLNPRSQDEIIAELIEEQTAATEKLNRLKAKLGDESWKKVKVEVKVSSKE